MKSNEITAVAKLLEMLTLKSLPPRSLSLRRRGAGGTIVTVDALNCQREIAQQIVDQGGDYVLALKGNQGTLLDDVSRFLDDPESEVSTVDTTVDGDHGRIETRTATVSTKIDWLQEDHHWPGLAAPAFAGAGYRQGGPHSGNSQQDHDRDGLLPTEYGAVGRTLE